MTGLRLPEPESVDLVPESQVRELLAKTEQELSALQRQAVESAAAAELAEQETREAGIDPRLSTRTMLRLQNFLDEIRAEVDGEVESKVARAHDQARARLESAQALAAHRTAQPTVPSDPERLQRLLRPVAPVPVPEPAITTAAPIPPPVVSPEALVAPEPVAVPAPAREPVLAAEQIPLTANDEPDFEPPPARSTANDVAHAVDAVVIDESSTNNVEGAPSPWAAPTTGVTSMPLLDPNPAPEAAPTNGTVYEVGPSVHLNDVHPAVPTMMTQAVAPYEAPQQYAPPSQQPQSATPAGAATPAKRRRFRIPMAAVLEVLVVLLVLGFLLVRLS